MGALRNGMRCGRERGKNRPATGAAHVGGAGAGGTGVCGERMDGGKNGGCAAGFAELPHVDAK